MCGITGFISLELNRDLLHEVVNHMSQKLFHRGRMITALGAIRKSELR